MHRALVLFALGFAGATACGSSSGSGVSQQVCALASACGSQTGFGSSFGKACEQLSEEANLANFGFLGVSPALVAADVSCAEAATDCASFRACQTVPSSAAAACKGASHAICSQGYVVECGSTLDGKTQGENCGGAGLICASDLDNAGCGTAKCDPTKVKPKCNGDQLVTCSPSGALNSEDCSAVGETCLVAAGMATCGGTGAKCDGSTMKSSCDGSKIIGCAGGKLAKVDCTLLDPAATCKVENNEANCVGAGKQCTDDTPETCSKGVIHYCSWGTKTTVDCKAFGLSGCKMVSATAAACTP
jgi:hypothetical protein